MPPGVLGLVDLDELVAAAAKCWAADDRKAASILLDHAAVAAHRALTGLSPHMSPLEALTAAAGDKGIQSRDLERLRSAFGEGALGARPYDASTFLETARALRTASRVMRRRDPAASRRARVRLALLMAFGVIALGVGVFVALAYVERPEDAIYGGDGGREYTLRCPPGTVVVGADVHVRGAYLSGMSPLCLAPDAEAGADPRPLRLVGEAREVAQRIRCPEGDVAVGVSGGAGVVVDRLLFLCGPAGDPTRRASNTRAAGGSGGRSFSARCRDGALLGLRGRSGANLDSVGTLCDPLTSR